MNKRHTFFRFIIVEVPVRDQSSALASGYGNYTDNTLLRGQPSKPYLAR